ncbi:hypothetical protein O181_002814 [Austropuccinia psidii MF-1]|uniref:Chromo domain-containing protein n=1 Tax=Austropuccinia psidii MF-1 TaxID=1389203 RepID=A0A9Q3BD58_9BASI|nr:hypothetical protein [Austropuccinia psidii MF-1]
MVGSFSNLGESQHSFLPPQAPISMEVHPPTLPYFTLRTSQDINNPKSESRASSFNKHSRRRGILKRGKSWYLVEWKGFSQDPQRSTWEQTENLNNLPEITKDFHFLYPEKPGTNSSRA